MPGPGLEQDLTLGATLRRTVERFPDRIFIRLGEREITFRDADRQVDRLASGLLSLGVKRHDRVALWLPNTPEWVLLAFACARIGAMIVTLNTRYKGEETAYILRQSKARLLIMLDAYWGIDYADLLRAGCPVFSGRSGPLSENPELPHLKTVVVLAGADLPGSLSVSPLLASIVPREVLSAAAAAVEVSDSAVAVYTSGTTGYSKGAVHSHIIIRNCRNIARALHVEPGDIILGHMPLYHIAGLCTAMIVCAALGCTYVAVPHWQPDEVAVLIARHKITIFGGIPTHFIDLSDSIERLGLDTSCLKSAWIGGATVTPDVARRAKDVIGLSALQSVYGMTETTSTTVLSRFEDPIDIVCENKGIPIGDFEVMVVDPATGVRRPTGVDGEIWVRGYIVMQGYLDDPEATAQVMSADGWFKTGDLGQFDAAGYLKVTGRLKDMFIVGGSKAYPAEIERVLQAHPLIRQAVVVGVPHRRMGEIGFAFIQKEPGAHLTTADVLAYARQNLADYKVPRHLRFVEEFPLTSTNKIQRFVLAKQAANLVTAEAG